MNFPPPSSTLYVLETASLFQKLVDGSPNNAFFFYHTSRRTPTYINIWQKSIPLVPLFLIYIR